MTPAEVEALLSQPLNAVVATARVHGGPQLTPVWLYWDGKTFRFSTSQGRLKYANIKREPQIALIVEDTGSHYVVAHGCAQIVEGDARAVADLTRPLLAKYADKYAEGDVEAMMAELAKDPNRAIALLRPERLVAC